jgi:serine/threonine protein kinase
MDADEEIQKLHNGSTTPPQTREEKTPQGLDKILNENGTATITRKKSDDETPTIQSQKSEDAQATMQSKGKKPELQMPDKEQLKSDPLGNIFADDKTSIIDSSKKYELIKKLGEGGMGEIWEANDTIINRIVAIKKMKGVHPDRIRRFLNEARITGQLEHPNIPPVHDLTENNLEFAMKLIHGEDLLKIIQQIKENKKEYKQKYPKKEMLKIFSKACEALAFAHSEGVIHRDIKPENIMVGKFGEVQVMDWGLAKKIGTPDNVGKSAIPNHDKANTQGLTMAGSIMGTPIYMSPEQAGAELEEIDAQSDIYSLGATLFELLSLEKPIKVEKGDKAMNIVYKVLQGKIRKIRRTPKELESIVKKNT